MRRTSPQDALTIAAVHAVAIAAGVLLLLPTLVVILASFTPTSYLSFPPSGFSTRWFQALAANRAILDAARTSLWVAALATASALGLGLLAAFPLVRGTFPARELVNAFLLSPLMIPSVVIGVALLFWLGMLGVPLSRVTLVLGHTVITLPYVVRLLIASLSRLDPAQEEAALGLGASRLQTLTHVTLPQLIPGLAAGAGFAFIESFDNLAISLFIAGQRTETLPMRLFQLLITDIDPVVSAVSSVVVVGSFLLMIVLARVAGLSRAAGLE